VGQDIERLRIYYNNHGFFDASVDTTVRQISRGHYRITFNIDEGEPSDIRNVSYRGLPDYEDPDETERFYSSSLLARNASAEEADSAFSVNRQYSVELIRRERNRILNSLHRNGYASASRDSIIALVRPDPEDDKILDIRIRIQPGEIYYFGDVYLRLRAPASQQTDEDDEVKADTLSGEPYTLEPYQIIFNIGEATQTRQQLLRQRLLFKPGERFNNDLYMSTVRQFQSLRMLSIQQFSLTESGGQPDYSETYLPVSFDMETLPRHQIRTDFFGIQRLGLGAGAGIEYSNNNIFGRAERLELSLSTSYEFISGEQNDPRSFEVSANYSYPRFAFPFRAFNNNPGFLNPETTFQLSYAQIRQINFNVDNNLRFNLRYQANHDRTTTSLFDLLELEWFDASITSAFREAIEDDTEDPLLTQLILEDYRPQISSVLRYTFRNAATHPIRRDNGFFLETSLEVGGNLPYLLENTLIDRPDSLRSTIPSFSSSGQELSYSQFVKASMDYRRYHPVAANTVLAWRLFGGMAQTYGLSRSIPITRRFFAGGSSDIRGWDPLTLGPGTNDRNVNPINGGDIKLAGYVELRNTFSRNFLNTDWIVALFTDFGNVWNGPRNEISEGRFAFDQFYNEIAVGSGIGLRLDWEFVILRLDLAYRVTDLGNEPGTSVLERNTIHFGIGHSF
jgi:outer membrane protein assembly factor BamA